MKLLAETITGSNDRKGSEMPAEGKATHDGGCYRMKGTPAEICLADPLSLALSIIETKKGENE